MSLPGEDKEQEQNSGSRNRELCHPDGDTVRKQL
jgi:hypothetical protein